MNIVMKAGAVLGIASLLEGCLLISPFHGQVLDSRADSIPFQAWTIANTGSLTVECMPTNRFGPGISSHGPWTEVTTISVSGNASLDLKGNAMYSAAKTISLPQSCWYFNQSNEWYYTSIRVLRNNDEYYTVNRDGIRCVMESVGDSGRWAQWLSGEPCYQTYTNGSATRWLTMRTQG